MSAAATQGAARGRRLLGSAASAAASAASSLSSAAAAAAPQHHPTETPKPFPLVLEHQRVSSTTRMVRGVDQKSPYSTPFIPLVNFEAFLGKSRKGTSAAQAEVIEAVKYAYSEGQGFMLVEGTSIDEALTTRVFSSARDFFKLDRATKARFCTPKGDLGYIVPTRDNDQIIQEYLNVGYAIRDPAAADKDPYFSSEMGKMFFQHTHEPSYTRELDARWPAPDVMALGNHAGTRIKRDMLEYYDEMERFSDALWKIFGRIFGLPEDALADISRRNISHMQVNHYPMQPNGPPAGGKMRIRQHFDVNAFSILRNDESGSERGHGNLQVFTRDGEWKDMPVIPQAYVVNVGELLARWTNGRLHHVLHRVTNPRFDPTNPAPDRLTIGHFAFPDYDAVIDAFPNYQPADAKDRKFERPMTCGEHSRIGRRLGQKYYDAERLEKLRVAQGLYGKDEKEF